jgi:hypothetical protein
MSEGCWIFVTNRKTRKPSAATTKPSAATTKPSAATTKPSAATTKPSAVASNGGNKCIGACAMNGHNIGICKCKDTQCKSAHLVPKNQRHAFSKIDPNAFNYCTYCVGAVECSILSLDRRLDLECLMMGKDGKYYLLAT